MAAATFCSTTLGRRGFTTVTRWVGKVESTDRDDDVHQNAQHALKVVGLAVAEEGSHDEHGKNQGSGIE